MKLLSIVVTVALFAATGEAAAVGPRGSVTPGTATTTGAAPGTAPAGTATVKQAQRERKANAKAAKQTASSSALTEEERAMAFSTLPFERRALLWQYGNQVVDNVNAGRAPFDLIPVQYHGRYLERLRDDYLRVVHADNQQPVTTQQQQQQQPVNLVVSSSSPSEGFRQALNGRLGVQVDPATGRLIPGPIQIDTTASATATATTLTTKRRQQKLGKGGDATKQGKTISAATATGPLVGGNTVGVATASGAAAVAAPTPFPVPGWLDESDFVEPVGAFAWS